ncbi:hypothetical protein D3C78_1697460 [compost metagenome]
MGQGEPHEAAGQVGGEGGGAAVDEAAARHGLNGADHGHVECLVGMALADDGHGLDGGAGRAQMGHEGAGDGVFAMAVAEEEQGGAGHGDLWLLWGR